MNFKNKFKNNLEMEETNSANRENRKPHTATGGQRNPTVHSLQNAYRVNYAN